MRDSNKALMIMATMSVIYDILEGREIDPSDFDDAIEMIGFNSKEFRGYHPFKMIHELSKILASIDMTDKLIDELIADE